MRNRYWFMEEAGAETATGGAPDEGQSPSQAPDSAPQPTDWRSSLPPELKDSPSLQDVPDLQTLVKNYEHTKAMVGNSVRIPTEEAGADDLDAFRSKVLERDNLGLMRKPDLENEESMAEVYKALGRPEDVSGYQVPEGVNAEEFGAMSEAALRLGLSKRQYEGLAEAMHEKNAAMLEVKERERRQGMDQIRGELGPPAFDQRSDRIGAMVKAMGGFPGLEEAIATGGLNADAWRFLDAVATQLGTEGAPMAQQIGQVTESSVADIKQRIIERTNKMVKENLSPAEHQEMIKRNIADQEKLAAFRK